MRAYYKKHLLNRSFISASDLHQYILKKQKGVKSLTLAVRVYLNFCEEKEYLNEEILTKYRKVIKCIKSKSDVYVPTNNDLIATFNIIKSNESLELVFLILMTSGIRYIECLNFLKNFDESKIQKHQNFVSYNVSNTRNTKNINNIYLSLQVYNKLKKVTLNYNVLRKSHRLKGAKFSLKYLRKWHYNFMIYNNVPESVADFIQGRASKSISSNHYLAKSQQAEFWYSKIVSNLESIIITTQFQENSLQTSDMSHSNHNQTKQTILEDKQNEI